MESKSRRSEGRDQKLSALLAEIHSLLRLSTLGAAGLAAAIALSGGLGFVTAGGFRLVGVSRHGAECHGQNREGNNQFFHKRYSPPRTGLILWTSGAPYQWHLLRVLSNKKSQ